MWMPSGERIGGVVVLHGSGSCKENQYDVAREFAAAGIAAVCFDQRGHGTSDGPMDERILTDVATIAELLPAGPLALRGSSMGGWIALAAADLCNADVIVAICPATADQLAYGITSDRVDFNADSEAICTVLNAGDQPPPTVPVLLMHAAGDEIVPVTRSRVLAEQLPHPGSRYIEQPGGHHRSLQHDPEMVAEMVRFTAKHLSGA